MSGQFKAPVIVDVFGDIVDSVSTELTPTLQAFDGNITGVHYLHGHPLEITNILSSRDKSRNYRYQKYPLVGLFQDFPERTQNRTVGFVSEVTLHVIIARSTKNDYRASQRYEFNFKPVLYPIYDALLKAIDSSSYFTTYGIDNIERTKYDRLYWGRSEAFRNTENGFNDYLDCIEIRDLKLKVNRKLCFKHG